MVLMSTITQSQMSIFEISMELQVHNAFEGNSPCTDQHLSIDRIVQMWTMPHGSIKLP